MIKVTKLNGHEIILNAEMIRQVESTPDTLITLVGGEKVIVKETQEQVVHRAIEYGQRLRRLLPPS